MPEIRRGERRAGSRPHRPDLRAGHVRSRVSAQGRRPWRRLEQLRLCRRGIAPARERRQPAALAGDAAAIELPAEPELSGIVLSATLELSRERGASALRLWRLAWSNA